MSVHVTLTKAPEYYTNLDIVEGKAVIFLDRPEQVGAIIVKLEGESRTALGVAAGQQHQAQQSGFQDPGSVVQEIHKILYKVAQVFPDDSVPASAVPVSLPRGQHEFPFRFKIPFNNGCSDPNAMARIGGLVGAGGFVGPSLFGMGGIRVMDGSKQLLYPHVTKTLPPSFTGFPGMAEIRYFIKVTVQRPGLFKENWRYNVGLKFLPIEPPRPPAHGQEAYARRPFTFRPVSPAPELHKKGSFFGAFKSSNQDGPSTPTAGESASSFLNSANALKDGLPPSIEVSARLPHPAILTCNKPVPLRIITKKLVPSREIPHLVSFQLDLISSTNIRCRDLINTEMTRWVIVSRPDLNIPVCEANAAVGDEFTIPEALWAAEALPNTVMPSFVTCNLGREYRIELRIGIAWRQPGAASRKGKGKASQSANVIHLPLHFSNVEVFSGMTPPASLLNAMRNNAQNRPQMPNRPSQAQQPSGSGQHAQNLPPTLPPRRPTIPKPAEGPGGVAPPYDDAPPSYDEAMAGEVTGPVFPSSRPAYSGMTNENAPSTIPEKNG